MAIIDKNPKEHNKIVFYMLCTHRITKIVSFFE